MNIWCLIPKVFTLNIDIYSLTITKLEFPVFLFSAFKLKLQTVTNKYVTKRKVASRNDYQSDTRGDIRVKIYADVLTVYFLGIEKLSIDYLN